MNVVPVGPLAISVAGLLVLAGMVTALAINSWLHRHGRPSIDGVLWWLLLAGIVAARVAFVLRWWPEYAAHPLSIIDVRDGGWSAWAGVVVVLVGAAWTGWRRRALREPLAWALLGGLLVWGAAGFATWRLAQASHPPLPSLVLRDLDGRSRSLQQFRGQPLVINLWASWCGPCRAEMPVLARAQRQRSGVRFVFANQGESAETIRAFLADQGLQLDGVFVDPFSQVSQNFGVRGYPTTLFFDADGSLLTVHTGGLSSATLAAELRHITRDAVPATPAMPGVSP